jgi:hypothetical protein
VNSTYADVTTGPKFNHDDKDSKNLKEKFPPGTFLDVVVELDRVKLSGSRRICTRVVKIIATELGELTASGAGGFHLTTDDYDVSKVNIVKKLFKYEKGGQYFKAEYDSKPLKLRMTNVTGWLSSNADLPAFGDAQKRTNKELGKTAYTLRIDIDKKNEPLNKMLTDINGKLQGTLRKFTNKDDKPDGFKLTNNDILKKYKSIFDHSKADKDLIKANQEPKYGKSLTVKLFYKQDGKDVREQFGTKSGPAKFVDAETGETIYDPTTYVGRVNIKSVDMYIRHIWLAAESISTNFTLNKVEFSNAGSRSYELTLDEVDAPNYDSAPAKSTSAPKKPNLAVAKSSNDEEDEEDEEIEDSDGEVVE